MIFEQQWQALHRTASDDGESLRRVVEDSKANAWLVIRGSSRLRLLRVEVPSDEGLEDLPQSAGIGLQIRQSQDGKYLLEVSLLNGDFEKIFDVFANDLLVAISEVVDWNQIGIVVAGRIELWQEFLKSQHEGLSAERVRGLVGELVTLRKLSQTLGFTSVVKSWAGPRGFSQDFHFKNSALEIKSSASKKPQSIQISSERQLDDAGLENLFLWHISLDERIEQGETLPEIVESIRANIGDLSVKMEFNLSLILSGYHDIHAAKYSKTFLVRSESLYRVMGNFPRITEGQCPSGLGNVKYSIQAGALDEYVESEAAVIDELSRTND